MKKLLVVVLAFAVSTGVFAQASVTGQLHTMFGLRLHSDNSDFVGGLPNHGEPQWDFSFLNSQTWIQFNYGRENVTGWVRLRATDMGGPGSWRAQVAGRWNDFELGMGFIELPWVQWSGISFAGDSNWGIGAMASTVNPYVFGRLTVADGTRVYLGLSEANRVIAPPDGTPRGGQWLIDDHPIPGFFVGFDHVQPGAFSFGLAFAGVPAAEGFGGLAESTFPFMIGLHGRFFDLGPLELGVNLALYNDPQWGFFSVATGPFSGVAQRGPGADEDSLMVMEAMLDLRIPLDMATFVISYGLLMNFDGDREDLGMQIAAQATIPLGNGFSLIPGVRFRIENDGNETASQTDIGVHVRFNF